MLAVVLVLAVLVLAEPLHIRLPPRGIPTFFVSGSDGLYSAKNWGNCVN